MPFDSLPPRYVEALAAEVLALLQPTGQAYLSESMNPGCARLQPLGIRMDVFGVSVSEAMLLGRSIDAAYTLDHAFAAIGFRLYSKEPLNKDLARQYTEIMEKSYLATHTDFKKKAPGGPFLCDESTGTTLHTHKDPVGTIEINPFKVANEIQGSLQYLPMNVTIQAVRMIMVPGEDFPFMEILDVAQESGQAKR